MTTTTPTLVDTLTFESPVTLEGTWGERQLADKAKSKMEFWQHDYLSGYIDWDIPDLDMGDSIGVTFEADAKTGKRTLVDYDGVFSIPDQAMDLLERNGIDCAEMRKTMHS